MSKPSGCEPLSQLSFRLTLREPGAFLPETMGSLVSAERTMAPSSSLKSSEISIARSLRTDAAEGMVARTGTSNELAVEIKSAAADRS